MTLSGIPDDANSTIFASCWPAYTLTPRIREGIHVSHQRHFPFILLIQLAICLIGCRITAEATTTQAVCVLNKVQAVYQPVYPTTTPTPIMSSESTQSDVSDKPSDAEKEALMQRLIKPLEVTPKDLAVSL